jgi:hypothetical protein
MEALFSFVNNTQSSGPVDILINILLSAIFSGLISLLYIKFGKAISNRKQFSASFLLITICTALIISLIKSSVALSLGLVGALSIVRFRTAIKEPEELTYLFLCIAIGLGFGANERLLTISSGLLILVILVIRGLMNKEKISNSFNLSIKTSQLSIEDIVSTLKKHTDEISFKRLEKDEALCDFLVNVQISDYRKLESCINDLTKMDENVKVSFLANQY